MATYRALKGTHGRPDAHALTVDPPLAGLHLIIVMKNCGTFEPLLPNGKPESDPDWSVVEVEFDEADIVSWEPRWGHPGVIALTLSDYTVGDTLDSFTDEDPPSHILGDVDVSRYEIPTP